MPDTLYLLWLPTEGAFWRGPTKAVCTSSSELAHKFLTERTAYSMRAELGFEFAIVVPYDVQPVRR